MSRCWSVIAGILVWAILAPAQEPLSPPQQGPAKTVDPQPAYLLGPGDEITIWVLGADEISSKPARVDTAGQIDLPLVGRLRVAGLTAEQLKTEIAKRLESDFREPQVTVSVTAFGSQPVSVLGAVSKPGVYQLQGRKTLVEVLALAEGVRQDAGSSVRITRRREHGPIPLTSAQEDPINGFSVAEVNLQALLASKNPEENIAIQPRDIVSVSRADTVYVIGEVRKPGAFVLADRRKVSVLQALSLAEGLNRTAAPQKARILRLADDGQARAELPVDVNRILDGKALDTALQPEDILFVPNSRSKNAMIRAAEAALSIGSGIAVWRVGLPR